MSSPTDPFVRHRSLLFTVAYEMLGSAADAEDVLQETWLRWVRADQGQVRDPRAYLVRITTQPTVVNGNPALVMRVDGAIDGIIAIRVEDARITGLYYVRNPEKLSHVISATPLTLH